MNKTHLTQDIHFLKRENNPHRQNAITFSCLGKLQSANLSLLNKWKTRLGGMIQQALNKNAVPCSALIIGLAESGIIPSALFHQILREQGIHAEWICSTRRPSSGIHFKETHSHGPDHILPMPFRQPEELWFVEDEITTGRTVLQLALNLCEVMNIRQVRFFAIADTRSSEDASRFEMLLNDHGIEHSLHVLFMLGSENSPPERGTGSVLAAKDIRKSGITTSDNDFEANWHFPRQRPALRSQFDASVYFSERFPTQKEKKNCHGTLLPVGEAVDIALRIIQEPHGLSFRHVTLSPWQIDGKNIFSRLDICGKYYLYNYHHLKSPLYILRDPVDAHIGKEMVNLLTSRGFVIKGIF